MSATRKQIYIADASQELLEIIGGRQSDDVELSVSSAVNLAVQFCALTVQQTKVGITANELLFCCDILNGGAQLTEFEMPDTVSISNALERMRFTINDALFANYGGELEKWGIEDHEVTFDKFKAMSLAELLTVAIATRQFWSGKGFLQFKKVSECGDYQAWAAQYCSS